MRRMYFANDPPFGREITAFVEDGVLTGLTVETDGIRSQDYVMSQLVAKFGPPMKFEKVKVQNMMGATFVADRAVWALIDCVVKFDGDGSDGGEHDGKIDEGWISIETRKKYEERIERLKDDAAKRQSF